MKQGWEIKKLGDVLEKTETIDPTKQPDKIFLYLDVSSVNKETKKIEFPTTIFGKDAPSRARKLIKENDIIFATVRPTHCRVALITPEYNHQVCSTGYFVIRVRKEVISSYIFYFILTSYFMTNMEKLQKGANYPAVSENDVKNTLIPIPPLPEQERIVSILDKAFSAIDQAKQNAETNLKNAKELFDSYLNKIFTNKGDDWEDMPLKEIAEYFNGLTYSPKDVSDDGILVLRSSNIQNDELDFNDNVYVNLTVKDKIKVKENDILMCSRNGSKRLVGKTAKIQGLNEEMTFGTFMMIIRSDYHEILSWFFKSINFKKQISQGENTMINQITRYMLDDIVIPMPKNKDTQIKISNYLKNLQLNTKNLENIYQQKLIQLEELKKSILQKAFNGDL